jgi:3-hydroxyisobutyrate dehydrogenase-like beta-hydroxyacid dehydrogenase
MTEATHLTSGPPVAFIGLGAMGEPMAANLCRNGVQVVAVAHRRREPLERLMRLGAREAATPAEAARAADFAILMLPTSAEVDVVIFGNDGLCRSLRSGAVIVDCGTSDPRCTRSAAARLRERGIAMVDAPVSRGVAGARDARLSFFIGGDAEVIARVHPLLKFIGNDFHTMGPVGAGHTAKLLNNLISLSTVTLAAEALALGKAAGLDAYALLGALRAGSANSSILASHGRRMIDGEYQPGFTVDLARKDLGLALALASEHAVPAFVGAAAHQVYGAAAARGRARQDVAAVRACFQD